MEQNINAHEIVLNCIKAAKANLKQGIYYLKENADRIGYTDDWYIIQDMLMYLNDHTPSK